ncbi:phospholipase D-like domain-containing protein [Blastococcus sp. PRF04-17]|uniref:phospholipase D-like domain-containing protein n=1 Tax=Blastococcus sp. PRF04-17 TaxID=2933797 RepID=UPI001FF4DF4E|nr:phospholipase D-like domain-containing protein [Blastococcus sp. PRF04-17]UOY00282.1 phospholipase D-like domain-containing protein [Blastococcus sp. PRF04-17]
MRDLVPLATALADLAGGYAAALAWTDELGQRGAAAFASLGVRGDAAQMLRGKATTVRLLRTDGTVDRVRLAQMVLVLDTLAAVPPAQPAAVRENPLVFTVPRAAQQLVGVAQRLDLLVNDVVARANSTLHIGGPFWNAGGWERLRPVVIPALATRHVPVTFYLHPHESGHLQVVGEMLAEARCHGVVHERWWVGGSPSLMHAKFVVADGSTGYFGSANLTSLGLAEHLEVGVALTAAQAQSLLSLLVALEEERLFSAEQPA